jgi:hypothetical protein
MALRNDRLQFEIVQKTRTGDVFGEPIGYDCAPYRPVPLLASVNTSAFFTTTGCRQRLNLLAQYICSFNG